MIKAEQWARQDAAVKTRLMKECNYDLSDPKEDLAFFYLCYYYHPTCRHSNERFVVLPYYLANWMNKNTLIAAGAVGGLGDLKRALLGKNRNHTPS